MTIPLAAFRGANLEPGEVLKAEGGGPGRIILTRVDELLDRYSGCLQTDGTLREQVKGLREDWR